MKKTRKIQLLVNPPDINEKWAKIRKMEADTFRGANLIMSNQYFNDTFRERIVFNDKKLAAERKKLDNEISKIQAQVKEKNLSEKVKKTKKERLKKLYLQKKNLDKKAREKAEIFYTTGEKNSTYKLLGEHYPELPSYVKAALNNLVANKYKQEVFDVKTGKRALSSFRKGFPIPFMKSAMRFEKSGNQILLHWVDGITFTLNFGRDLSNNRSIIDKILNKEYKYSDSSIKIEGKKLFLLLVVDIPARKAELDKNIAVGVDLGLAIPAYCALSEGYPRLAIGNRNDFLRVRTQMQNRKKALQKSLILTSEGRGRAKKLKALEKLKKKERNFVHTYNHMVSKRVVEFARKNNAGVIKLELLEGYGRDDNGKPKKGDFVLRNWSYFELQKLIEEKAAFNGIKVVYIDPYHTSQTCSFCGHYEEGQRISQSRFLCKNPECSNKDKGNDNKEINADYNAARNIAKSIKIVTSKEECTFYLQKAEGK